MLIRSLQFLALSVTLACTLTSGQSDYCETDVNSLNQISPPVNHKSDLVIKSVEFFAWWTIGQKKDYLKLDRWKDTSDPKVPHPTVFDVVCEIENGDTTLQDGDLIVLTTVDSLVAPTYLAGGDVNKIMNEVGWGRGAVMDDVKIETVPYLKAGQLTRIQFKGFNLSKLVQAFPGKEIRSGRGQSGPTSTC